MVLLLVAGISLGALGLIVWLLGRPPSFFLRINRALGYYETEES